MKTIFTILLFYLSSGCLFAQTPAWEGKFTGTDKALHFTASAAFTMLAIETAKDWKVKNPEVAGITAGFAIGLAKEFLYDSNQSSRDLLADFTGCVAGVYINRWFNSWETKKYFKKTEPQKAQKDKIHKDRKVNKNF